MSSFFLYGVGIPLTLWLSAMGGALWLAARFGGRGFVWAISGLGAMIIVALTADALIGCAADPIFIAPSPEEALAGLAGETIYPCDTPLRGLMLLTLYVTAPMALLGQAILTWWMLDKVR